MFLANIDPEAFYRCGNLAVDISGWIPYAVHIVVTLIKIVVPILLIIFGMLDLGKAVVASKEDEIKKGQQLFIKRLITGVLVFFVVFIVQIIVRFVSNSNSDITKCFNCFINDSADPEKGCAIQS